MSKLICWRRRHRRCLSAQHTIESPIREENNQQVSSLFLSSRGFRTTSLLFCLWKAGDCAANCALCVVRRRRPRRAIETLDSMQKQRQLPMCTTAAHKHTHRRRRRRRHQHEPASQARRRGEKQLTRQPFPSLEDLPAAAANADSVCHARCLCPCCRSITLTCARARACALAQVTFRRRALCVKRQWRP